MHFYHRVSTYVFEISRKYTSLVYTPDTAEHCKIALEISIFEHGRRGSKVCCMGPKHARPACSH